MDPSLFLCSVTKTKESIKPVSLQDYSGQTVPSIENISTLTTTKIDLPLYTFNEKEALLWADLDSTFRFTDALPLVFWSFPTEQYPARQAFNVSYLTPRLIGNYNIGNWKCPGIEYFVYRRPEYFQFARDKEKNERTMSLSEKDFLKTILEIQPDGLNIFISWTETEKCLNYALKTLFNGANFVARLEEQIPPDLLQLAGQNFDKTYLFKPILSEELFLVCMGKKESPTKKTFPVDEYIDYGELVLHMYKQAEKKGKLPYLPPSTCYIRWNLPQEQPKKNIICFKRSEELVQLEDETGTEKDILDSSQWNTRTSALAFSKGKVFIAKPYYLGGWNLLGEYKDFPCS